jgi:ion channel-forming bestrophin family protein
MIEYDRYDWAGTVFSYRGTALRRAFKRVLFFTVFAVLVQIAYVASQRTGSKSFLGLVGLEPAVHSVLGSLLGFLIVFRMNGSNARYWEGRSHWAQIINSSRNLIRVGTEHGDNAPLLADLISAYSVSLRRSLQGKIDLDETEMFLADEVREKVRRFGNPPTGIAAEISEWIAGNRRRGRIEAQVLRQMEDQLSKLVDAQGNCEKIRKTPLPFTYVVMIKQLIVVYLATLPFSVCHHCGWWAPVLVFIVSLGLFGMEEASVETEDPFGTEPNCLEMETYTLTIIRDAGQLVARKRDDPPHPGYPPPGAG